MPVNIRACFFFFFCVFFTSILRTSFSFLSFFPHSLLSFLSISTFPAYFLFFLCFIFFFLNLLLLSCIIFLVHYYLLCPFPLVSCFSSFPHKFFFVPSLHNLGFTFRNSFLRSLSLFFILLLLRTLLKTKTYTVKNQGNTTKNEKKI